MCDVCRTPKLASADCTIETAGMDPAIKASSPVHVGLHTLTGNLYMGFIMYIQSHVIVCRKRLQVPVIACR